MTHSMIAEQSISLDTRGLDSAFPFIIAISSDDTIVHLGPTLARVPRGPAVGQKSHVALRFQRRLDSVSYEALAADAPGFAVMVLAGSGMLLRGQLVLSSGIVLFLATPWVGSLDELASFGLSLYDFPPHDPIVDLLVLLQTKSIALDESALMTQRLDAVRARLEKALADAERIRTRLEVLVAAVPWGLLVEDETGRVALTNPAFCALCRYRWRASVTRGSRLRRPRRSGLRGLRESGGLPQHHCRAVARAYPEPFGNIGASRWPRVRA
jgi:PAS domain-containing protein